MDRVGLPIPNRARTRPHVDVEIVPPCRQSIDRLRLDPASAVDVVIFRLDGDGQWPAGWAPAPPPNAKLIAVAATGDQGWILLPGESEWSVIRPFGLDQLIREVLAGREYRPLSSPADLPPMR